MIIEFRLRVIVVLAAVCFFTACSSVKYSGGSSPDFHRTGRGFSQAMVKAAVPLPWETWPLSRTLAGVPLGNRDLLKGDEYVRRGDRRRALQVYSQIKPAALNYAEQEALTMRLAGMELAVGDALKALSLMSRFFAASGKTEEDIDGRFSLIFAYAYGRRGEIDQSLAWFSRARRQSVQGADQGVRMLLQSLTDEDLAAVSARWQSDSSVMSLAGQERHRRSRPEYNAAKPRGGAFWALEESALTAAQPGTQESFAVAGDMPKVGVILPLTGQFAALGNSTKNGIQLAFEPGSIGGASQQRDLEVIYHDDQGDLMQAAAAARELFSSHGAAMLLGPLLTDISMQIGEVANTMGKPIVTFSKSDSFQTGGQVFRLGPTVETQVDSLLQACQRSFTFSRYAVVYPDDPTGREFAAIFRHKVRELGLQVVFERGYASSDAQTFLQISKELEDAAVQAVFFPDNLRNAVRFFTTLSPPLRRTARPLGTASWDNALELRQSQAALDGAVFVSPFFMQSERPVIRQFISGYEAAFRRAPDFLAAQGFDAATIALDALRQSAGSGLSLTEALRRSSLYDGLTGRIHMRPDGEFIRWFAVVELDNGHLREISSETRNVITGIDAFSAESKGEIDY